MGRNRPDGGKAASILRAMFQLNTANPVPAIALAPAKPMTSRFNMGVFLPLLIAASGYGA
jgi:hypothetical protein